MGKGWHNKRAVYCAGKARNSAEPEKCPVIDTGLSVGTKIGAGKSHVIKNVRDIKSFKAGEALITEKTDPDWEPIMKIASAIVTNRGGRTAHAAIVARELGIPARSGT